MAAGPIYFKLSQALGNFGPKRSSNAHSKAQDLPTNSEIQTTSELAKYCRLVQQSPRPMLTIRVPVGNKNLSMAAACIAPNAATYSNGTIVLEIANLTAGLGRPLPCFLIGSTTNHQFDAE